MVVCKQKEIVIYAIQVIDPNEEITYNQEFLLGLNEALCLPLQYWAYSYSWRHYQYKLQVLIVTASLETSMRFDTCKSVPFWRQIHACNQSKSLCFYMMFVQCIVLDFIPSSRDRNHCNLGKIGYFAKMHMSIVNILESMSSMPSCLQKNKIKHLT